MLYGVDLEAFASTPTPQAQVLKGWLPGMGYWRWWEFQLQASVVNPHCLCPSLTLALSKK